MRASVVPLALVALVFVGCDDSSSGVVPTLVVEDTAKEVGEAPVGTATTPITIPFRNGGVEDLEIIAFVLKGADSADFVLQSAPLPIVLAPGASTSVDVVFMPAAGGVREAELCVIARTSSQPTITGTVELTGAGLPELLSGPTLTLDPNGVTPLAALLELETDVATRIRLTLDDGTTARRLELPGSGTTHALPVLGLRPATSYTVEVEISTLDGVSRTLGAPLSVRTDPLPADFPQLETRVLVPGEIEPGFLLFQVQSSTGRVLVALDETGAVVWYLTGPLAASPDLRRISNGCLLGLGRATIREFDMLGKLTTVWTSRSTQLSFANPIVVDAETFHHEVFELPNGNLVSLSRETRTVTGFPSSETDPAAPRITKDVSGDVVVEFQRDGTVIHEWSLLDVLDPRRIGYDAVGGDWSHGNAVIHDPRDEGFIISLRHQDCVVEIDRATGALRWILGPPENWGPAWDALRLRPVVSSMPWSYHTHAPMITASGELLLFDNGTHRASPFAPPLADANNHSRAVIYAIDEAQLSVAESWVYGGPGDELFYSRGFCDADELPQTGNILVTDGVRLLDNPMRSAARIVEVRRTRPAEKVFEVWADDPTGTVAYRIYRAEKLPSLYP